MKASRDPFPSLFASLPPGSDENFPRTKYRPIETGFLGGSGEKAKRNKQENHTAPFGTLFGKIDSASNNDITNKNNDPNFEPGSPIQPMSNIFAPGNANTTSLNNEDNVKNKGNIADLKSSLEKSAEDQIIGQRSEESIASALNNLGKEISDAFTSAFGEQNSTSENQTPSPAVPAAVKSVSTSTGAIRPPSDLLNTAKTACVGVAGDSAEKITPNFNARDYYVSSESSHAPSPNAPVAKTDKLVDDANIKSQNKDAKSAAANVPKNNGSNTTNQKIQQPSSSGAVTNPISSPDDASPSAPAVSNVLPHFGGLMSDSDSVSRASSMSNYNLRIPVAPGLGMRIPEPFPDSTASEASFMSGSEAHFSDAGSSPSSVGFGARNFGSSSALESYLVNYITGAKVADPNKAPSTPGGVSVSDDGASGTNTNEVLFNDGGSAPDSNTNNPEDMVDSQNILLPHVMSSGSSVSSFTSIPVPGFDKNAQTRYVGVPRKINVNVEKRIKNSANGSDRRGGSRLRREGANFITVDQYCLFFEFSFG